MKPVKVVIAVAALVALTLGVFAFNTVPAEAKEKHPAVRKLLHRSHLVLVHAWKAVTKGGEAKDAYRLAWIQQHAAWRQLKHDHPIVAARLSLNARGNARKVIEANKDKATEEEAKDEADEGKAAEGAKDEEVNAAQAESEKDAPTIEIVIKVEPKEGD